MGAGLGTQLELARPMGWVMGPVGEQAVSPGSLRAHHVSPGLRAGHTFPVFKNPVVGEFSSGFLLYVHDRCLVSYVIFSLKLTHIFIGLLKTTLLLKHICKTLHAWKAGVLQQKRKVALGLAEKPPCSAPTPHQCHP